MVTALDNMLAPGDMPQGEDAERAFIHLFGNILRMRNLLECFDQFAANDPLTERDRQDYVAEGGMELDDLMPPLDPNARRNEKIQCTVDRLKAFFNKYYSVADGTF